MDQSSTEDQRRSEPLDFSRPNHRSPASPASSAGLINVFGSKRKSVSFSVHLDTPSPSPENYNDFIKEPEQEPRKGSQYQHPSQEHHKMPRTPSPQKSSPQATAPINHLNNAQQHSPNSTAATAAETRDVSAAIAGLAYQGAAMHPDAANHFIASKLNQMSSPNSDVILQALLESRNHNNAPQASIAGLQLPNILASVPTTQAQTVPTGPFVSSNLAAAAAGFPVHGNTPTNQPANFLNYFPQNLAQQQTLHTPAVNPALLIPANNALVQPPAQITPPSENASSLVNIPAICSSGGTQKRRPPGKTPEHKKDQAYLEKRAKNNLAAKRSRDAKRMKEEATAVEAAKLSLENAQLKSELYKCKIELTKRAIQIQSLTGQPLTDLSPLTLSLQPTNLSLHPQSTQTSPSLDQLNLHGALNQPGMIANGNKLESPEAFQQQLAAAFAEQAAIAAVTAASGSTGANASGHHPLLLDPTLVTFLLQFFIDSQQPK